MRNFVGWVLLTMSLGGAAVRAQGLDPLSPKPAANQNANPLTNPGMSPEIEFLYQLEAKFAADTGKGGGKAFGTWFAPDVSGR